MSSQPPVTLSKSRIMSALQCTKQLHFRAHRPDEAVVSSSTQAAFDTGHAVGALARRLYTTADSVFIDVPHTDLDAAITQTDTLLRNEHRGPIFEATLKHDDVLVRVDVLLPDGPGWRIVEVKSSTRVKDEHVPDCAIQAWVCRQAGPDVRRIAVAHVDNTFIYQGNEDYTGLLAETDVTDAAMPLLDSVPDWINRARAAVSENVPDINVGRHCTKPYECAFWSLCWPTDTRFPISGLAGRKEKHFELVNEGFRDITEVPADRLTADGHRRIHRVTLSGEAEILEGARQFVAGLSFPRYYLDFETIAPAIQVWADSRPYEQLPVQFSLHIEHESRELDHEEFLDLSGDAPMRRLAERLIDSVGDQGPILMYTGFERRVVASLRDRFNDLATALESIMARLIDIQPPIRDNYYHPDMLGSWSIKSVIPTVAPNLSYDRLEEVVDGTAASNAFLEAIHSDTMGTRRDELKDKLIEYCRLDTEAMVALIRFFENRP